MTIYNNKKVALNEVYVLRLLLIVLLVLYHSFAPFTGSWLPLEGQSQTPTVYKLIGIISYSFMLECFTFISGYLYGFQSRRRDNHINKHIERNSVHFRRLIISKLKRLILPSIIFSAIYILAFSPSDFNSPHVAIIRIIEGAGHMWYLPMLFWCFIGTFIISWTKISLPITMILLVLLALLSFIKLPLQLSHTMYYIAFFYAGYVLKYHDVRFSKLNTSKIILSWIIFFFLLFGLRYIMSSINKLQILNFYPEILYMISRLSQLIYSMAGVWAALASSLYILEIKRIILSPEAIKLSSYCFGIYLLQQFILIALYYHIKWQLLFTAMSLPWIGFTMAMLLGISFTYLIHKTRIGRFLIG